MLLGTSIFDNAAHTTGGSVVIDPVRQNLTAHHSQRHTSKAQRVSAGSAQEVDLVDWVFNSAAVLRERASLMEQYEKLTYERDAVCRQEFGMRSSYLVNEVDRRLVTRRW